MGKTTTEEKNICIEKATEALGVVCDVIEPSAGPELLESCLKSESIANDLKPLMEAYKNAITKKRQNTDIEFMHITFLLKNCRRFMRPMRISQNGKSSAQENMPGNLDRAL